MGDGVTLERKAAVTVKAIAQDHPSVSHAVNIVECAAEGTLDHDTGDLAFLNVLNQQRATSTTQNRHGPGALKRGRLSRSDNRSSTFGWLVDDSCHTLRHLHAVLPFRVAQLSRRTVARQNAGGRLRLRTGATWKSSVQRDAPGRNTLGLTGRGLKTRMRGAGFPAGEIPPPLVRSVMATFRSSCS